MVMQPSHLQPYKTFLEVLKADEIKYQEEIPHGFIGYFSKIKELVGGGVLLQFSGGHGRPG
jgi:hypothetical protein